MGVLTARRKLPFVRKLDTVGDGTGNSDFTGDYSGANATSARLNAAPNQVLTVTRLVIHIVDSTGSYNPSLYGGLAALTNGVKFSIKNDAGTLVDFSGNGGAGPVKNMGSFSHYGKPEVADASQGTLSFAVHWELYDKFHPGILLDGSDGDYLCVDFNDDFTGLNHHHFVAHGYHGVYLT